MVKKKNYWDYTNAGQYRDLFKNTHNAKQIFYLSTVIDNKTILEDGTIKVALSGGTHYPYEIRDGLQSDTFDFHKSVELSKNELNQASELNNTKDGSWGKVKANIVNCYLATPLSGSFQNSGLFICPPINSKGIVAKIDGEYYWMMGVYRPRIKSQQQEQGITDVFLPFPSNVIETNHLNMEDVKNGTLKNKGNAVDLEKLSKERKLEIKVQKADIAKKTEDDISNLTLLEANEATKTERAKDIILLRTVYPGGDAIKNINKDREKGKIKDEKEKNILKQYDRTNFPTESILEISGKRFWIHKAYEWITDERVDLTAINKDSSESEPKIIGKVLEETKWIDFCIESLYGLDRFPHPDNKDKTLEEDLGITLDSLNGFGFSVNDTSLKKDKKKKRNIEYDTSTEHRKSMFNQNGESDKAKARKIDLKVKNESESTITLTLTNDKKEFNFTIDLDNNKVSILNKKDDDASIEFTLDSKNNLAKITNTKDSNNSVIFTLDASGNEASISEKTASGENLVKLNKDGIEITDKLGNTAIMTEKGIKIEDINTNKITMSSNSVDVNAAAIVNITSPLINLGGDQATHSTLYADSFDRQKWTILITALMSHTHEAPVIGSTLVSSSLAGSLGSITTLADVTSNTVKTQ